MIEQDKLDVWVKALRSGEYSQVQSALMKDGGYCCLGVAERVWYPDLVIPEYGNGASHDGFYPENVGPVAQNFFVDLNDKFNLSFEEIALVIENVPQERWA